MIEKFRLGWKSSPQQQYNELQKMVMHLANIANSMTDINVKLNVLAQIKSAIDNQGLLLQAISDNTACACNGLSQVNDNLSTINTNIGNKLDYIAGLIQDGATPPAGDTYLFELFLTSVEITQDIIDAGSFILSGVTRKNGAIFDELSLIDHYDFIESVSVLAPGQIEVQLVPGAEIPDGTLVIQIQQAESGIVQQLNIYYQSPTPVYVNYVELLDGTILPILSVQDVSALSTQGSNSITLSGYTFAKDQVKAVSLMDISVVGGVIPAYFCYGFTKLTGLSMPDNGIISIGSSFLGNCRSFNQPIVLPSGLTTIFADFLSGCDSFNSLISIPQSVTDIKSNFLVGAVSFNQPLTLPSGLSRIELGFMQACYGFNQPLSLPSSLTSVMAKFMYLCTSFTGPLNIGSLSVDIFGASEYTLAMAVSYAVSYVTGITVSGNNASAFLLRFPNHHSVPYRNLKLPVAPVSLSVSVQGDFITTGMSSQDAVIQIDSQKILDVDTDSSYHFNASGVGASVIPPSFELSGTILVNGARKQANLTFLIDIEGYSLVGSVLKSIPAKGEGSMSANQFNLQTADNGPLEVRFSIAGKISGSQITWVSCNLD